MEAYPPGGLVERETAWGTDGRIHFRTMSEQMNNQVLISKSVFKKDTLIGQH